MRLSGETAMDGIVGVGGRIIAMKSWRVGDHTATMTMTTTRTATMAFISM